MYTIDRIPRNVKSFFRPHREGFGKPAWTHFTLLVTAIAMATEHGLKQLNGLLRKHTHRTKDGEFLWQSQWNESAVLRDMALLTLKRLHRKGEPIYLILDDTQIPKRARKMDGVGMFFLHAAGNYGNAHCVLKACLHYRGVTIPWGSWLYVKKDQCRSVGVEFAKLTELAAQAIREAALPPAAVTVLFDSYYLCATVVRAVQERKWHYIGVVKSNRRFACGGQWHSVGPYTRNVLKRSGRWMQVKGPFTTRSYRLTERVGRLKSLGEEPVKLICSRRKGDGNTIALATNDLARSTSKVIADFSCRWTIELLIKDEKQHLGLGAYRVRRYRAVVRYLHLVDCAYACLTHMGLAAQCAQGHKKNQRVLRLATIRHLKSDLRQAAWRQMVEEVIQHSTERPVIRRLEKLLAA
jgi:SRSO17 transposase